MIEYISLIFIPTFVAFLGDLSDKKNIKKLMYIISFFILIFLTASRLNVGADYVNYQNAYNFQTKINLFDKFDFAFALLMKVSAIIHLNFHGFLFLCSLINFILIYKTFQYYDKNHISFLLIVYLLYFDLFVYSLSAMRQWFTISIHLFALRYIENGKFYKYLFFSVIGGLFHWSGYILILFYFIYRYLMQKGIKQSINFFIVLSILYFLLTKIFLMLLPFLNYNIYYYFFLMDDTVIDGNLLIAIIAFIIIIAIYFLETKVESFEKNSWKIFLTKKNETIPICIISIGIFLALKALQNIRYQNILPRFQMYFYCQLPIFLNYYRNKYFKRNYLITIVIITGLIILFYLKLKANYLYFGNFKYDFLWFLK